MIRWLIVWVFINLCWSANVQADSNLYGSTVDALITNETAYDWSKVDQQVINEAILPDYQLLAESAAALNQGVTEFCSSDFVAQTSPPTTGSKQPTQALKTLLIEFRLAWSAIQHIRFGPIDYLQRRDRLDFWPDKHNVAGRQLRKLLAEPDGVKFDLPTLAAKSVALQGISALERIVFISNQQITPNQCRLALLIAANIAEIANSTSTEWRSPPVNFKNEVIPPFNDNAYFNTNGQLASALINSLITQLRLIADIKIAKALPKLGKTRAYPRQLEGWRSGASLRLIEANLISIKRYYRLGFAAIARESNSQLDRTITELLDEAIKISRQLSQVENIAQQKVLSKPELLNTLETLRESISRLAELISSQLVPALGLSVQFNALDGD